MLATIQFALAWLLVQLALFPQLHGQTIRINELQTANDRTLQDEEGDSSDWMELWNSGPTPFDLGGCGLSDDFEKPFKWVFATNSLLLPGKFLLVFASGKDRQPQLVQAIAPESLDGLRLRLRADVVNVSDSNQVRMAGGNRFVRRWRDLSGSGNSAGQLTDSLQPQWLAVGASGFPAVRFDGANDLLQLVRPVGTNSFCLFVVCQTSQGHDVDQEGAGGVGGVSGQHWLFGAGHGGEWDAGAGFSVGTNGVSVYEHGSGYMPALCVYQRFLGNGLLLLALNYQNKQPSVDFQGLPGRVGQISSRREVWAPTEIGSGAYGAFAGDIVEVIGYDRSLNPDERKGVERYLAERYGVELPLPLHTSFQLSSTGEQLVLTGSDGVVLDQVSFGAVPRDVSYGRSALDPGQWLYFGSPTPGASNTSVGTTEWLLAPELSHAGGFYTNAFYLALTVPNAGAEIRYTLDGSAPTASSLLYTAPIFLRSRAGTPNDLSAIATVPGGQPPTGEVFKGWTVRARALKPGAMPGPIVTRTYWIHSQGRARYSLPVVSLTTDRRNFFDPNIGIYVPGNAAGGNYSQRGTEWQRPVHIEFYETNNYLAFAQEGDVKIHGNTSQNFPIKGLDLDGTGGEGRQPFRYAIFPGRDRSEFQHFLLRPSGHDHYMAFMRDELMQELGAETGAEHQAARPCVVFLNGEYWGLHYLKEKEDADFVAYYGGIPADGLDYLEGYAAAKAGDTRHYDAMMQLVSIADPEVPDVYRQMEALLEIPNYIDYKACEIFNYRWDIGNHRLWRPRIPEGRWRWLQFDNDVGWGGFGAEQPGWSYNMLEADLSTDGRLNGHNNETTTLLFRRLLRNQEFQVLFLNRFADLLNSTLLPTNTLAQIESLAAQLSSGMAEHCQRWRAPASLEAWKSSVNALRTFGLLRPEACRQHLIQHFQLAGNARLSVSVTPEGQGTVLLNSLRVPLSAGAAWEGSYFRGVPIPVRAEPQIGCRFVRWTGAVETPAPQTTVRLDSNTTLTAVFTTAPAVAPLIERIRGHAGDAVELTCRSEPSQTLSLEASEDLRSWRLAGWAVADDQGLGTFRVPLVSGRGCEFFRVRLP